MAFAVAGLQRLAALKQLAEERIAAARDLSGTVKAERLAWVADVDRISQKAAEHAFWRATQLFATLAVAAIIAVVGLLFQARRLFGKRLSADRHE